MIQDHLHQLIRVLGLHYNGIGWGIVRKRSKDVVPKEHALATSWYGEDAFEAEGKCFLRM